VALQQGFATGEMVFNDKFAILVRFGRLLPFTCVTSTRNSNSTVGIAGIEVRRLAAAAIFVHVSPVMIERVAPQLCCAAFAGFLWAFGCGSATLSFG
jgi:hypothetical protein